jgi:hypothetical protein
MSPRRGRFWALATWIGSCRQISFLTSPGQLRSGDPLEVQLQLSQPAKLVHLVSTNAG